VPSTSKSQQRFMGMVHAYQKGELEDAPESVKKAADSMTKKASKDFAKTKHKGLPEKVKETQDFGLDMTLDQLKQELEDLEKEHEETLMTGGEPETLDDIEQELENIHNLIRQKEDQMSNVNVAETFKSLTFKDYLSIIEEADKAKIGKSTRSKVYHADYLKTKDEAYRQYEKPVKRKKKKKRAV